MVMSGNLTQGPGKVQTQPDGDPVAGDGGEEKYQPFYREETTAEGKPAKERCGSTMGSQISGVLHDRLAQSPEDPHPLESFANKA